MNLDNIASLAAILSRIGFGNLTYPLLQHICCKPVQFTLSETIVHNSDRLSCQLCFERHANEYAFVYYDAGLIREQAMPALTINNVALQELEKSMMRIDWKKPESDLIFRLEDETTWAREKQVEQAMNELARLSVTDEGKLYADVLKVRFFSGTIVEQLTGSLTAIRSRLELSQRFYITDGDGITVNEALRFLQNRLVEKRLQLKKRQVEKNDTTGAQETDGIAGTRKQLIIKKSRRNKILRGRGTGGGL